ncbi:hypothetical protein, partial [Candidatus Deferrimicrobium sp.]|uniref:hypothetical protein n=1 Tax=Candidatus Deferrimicrobium sp. TaxID=3060586 RepID=UPI003C6F0C07
MPPGNPVAGVPHQREARSGDGGRAPATLASRVENAVSIGLLVGMALLPVLEIVGRRLWRTGIPGSGALVQHATLWI